MAKPIIQPTSPIYKYLLKDYTFLHDYIIIDTEPSLIPGLKHNKNAQNSECQIFIAQIMGTQQLVRFNKVGYEDGIMGRFEALVDLYERGAVLADNLFILQQAGRLYFYVIQAYIPQAYPQPQFLSQKRPLLPPSQSSSSQNISQLSLISPSNRYTTLCQYIASQTFVHTTLEYKIRLIDRIKILLECVHQTGQAYTDLTPDHIILDVEDIDCLYLAPFGLRIELGDPSRMRKAYICPQILAQQQAQAETKQRATTQIMMSVDAMMKADIWAFGCIMLDILFFSSPAFLAVSNANQIKQIHDFVTGHARDGGYTLKGCMDGLAKQGQSKANLLAVLLENCLQIDPTKRVFTSQKPTTQTITNIPPIIPTSSTQSDSKLILQLINITNMPIHTQLRINLYLDRRHSIFVSPSPIPNKTCHQINQRILVPGTFLHFYQLLQKPILIELCQQGTTQKIYADLGLLVLEDERARVWAQPIIGTYFCRDGDARVGVKIKSELVTQVDHIPFEKDRICAQIKSAVQNRSKTINKYKNKQNHKQTHNQTHNQIHNQNYNSNHNQESKQGVSRMQIKKQNTMPQKCIHKEAGNYFANINSSLQQIRLKWAKPTNQLQQKQQCEIVPISTNRQCPQNRQSLSIPSSLQSSRQVCSQQIQVRLRQMMRKLHLL